MRFLLFQFIHQSHKIICFIFGKHVKNLNLYRKNNIISLYKKTIFTCTSVLAAVVGYISLYSKIVSTVLLVALIFLLKIISAKNHEQRKYTHACNKGVYSVIH